MHDPMTVAFEIPNPLSWRRSYDGKLKMNSLATIWHVDPEKDGTDDSCGWFVRARHCCQVKLKKVESRFAFDWDADWGGWFNQDGSPRLSPSGITLQMFWVAAYVHFGDSRRKAQRYLQRNLADILFFAENNVDSLHSDIVGRYGITKREERIRRFASVVYSYVVRNEQPRWRHPRWHFWHWSIQVHPIQQFKRWAFSRCCRCGKRFAWGYSPTSDSWNGTGPRWFQSESQVYHGDCRRPEERCIAAASKPAH